MAERHLRVTQQRTPELGGLVELAHGTINDGDDTVHLTLLFPAERQVEMPLGQLEAQVASVNENSGWATVLVWDD